MKHDPNDTKSTHQIRLRGPCKLLWMRNGTQQAEVRVHIPGKIEPGIFESPPEIAADLFLLRRSFGQPTGLVSSQNVALELSGFEGAVRAVLNRESEGEIERAIEGDESLSIPIASSLMKNNTLEVEFRSLPAFAGNIRLVIEE